MIVILCAYLQNYVLTPGWAWSLWHQLLRLFVCARIKGFARSKKTIHLRLEKPCQCKQNSYQIEKNTGFLHPIARFQSNLQKLNMNRTERAKQKVYYYM